MHGVPRNLPVQFFVGMTLTEFRPRMNVIQFCFSSPPADNPRSLEVHVEGDWRLASEDGATLAMCEGDPQQEEVYRLIESFVGQQVVAAAVDAPCSFTFTFATGITMTVFDNSESFESFSIPQFSIYV